MNAILKDSKQIQYYTYLGPIFEAIHNRQHDFNWLLTDLELNWIPDDFLNYFEDYEINKGLWDRDNKYWISGDQLTNLITNNKIQFIWGVLSGFRKTENIEMKNLSVIPFADGNPELWKPGVTVQYPKAEIEIVCWDSELTLLISNDQSMVKSFMEFFKDAKDLDEYNLKD
ncbi:hypothetical protein ACYEXS_36090 [Paenibacillus sp. MAH-36]|uniref:Uncharacterized protein n=1 Tax=Paenibacillus violae TaxID=3077234 RepID=A0ABU3RQ39_9BACL|nr:hypothetical protein [Paenibacillus sp. PFR10]MDU0206415.1 hypothetical protein [Paenibacillus sp. PFR10]